ncbi:hypothetical protein ACHAXS_001980, partial [Conticribra weissflogii]
LTWEATQLEHSTTFLNLTIITQNGSIVTKTYQRAMNPYPYILAKYVHPPDMIIGVVTSLIKHFYHQNTTCQDFIDTL